MEKNASISLIASDMSIYDYSFRVAKGNDLYKDIVAEVIIYLYDMDNTKFSEIKDLKSYVCKMIWFSWNSSTSPFYRKYRNDLDVIEKDYGFEEIDSVLEELNVIENDIENSKNRPAYEVRIFKMYVDLGSYRAVAKKLDMSTMNVYKICNTVIEKMKKKI